jgi:hypothetical protein
MHGGPVIFQPNIQNRTLKTFAECLATYKGCTFYGFQSSCAAAEIKGLSYYISDLVNHVNFFYKKFQEYHGDEKAGVQFLKNPIKGPFSDVEIQQMYVDMKGQYRADMSPIEFFETFFMDDWLKNLEKCAQTFQEKHFFGNWAATEGMPSYPGNHIISISRIEPDSVSNGLEPCAFFRNYLWKSLEKVGWKFVTMGRPSHNYEHGERLVMGILMPEYHYWQSKEPYPLQMGFIEDPHTKATDGHTGYAIPKHLKTI